MNSSSPLGALIAASLMEGSGKKKQSGKNTDTTIMPEAQIERLQEFGARYTAGNPFEIGDFVVPRAESGMTYEGQPHLVIDILVSPRYSWETKEVGSQTYGNRIDIRVAVMADNDHVAQFWGESHLYERWTAE